MKKINHPVKELVKKVDEYMQHDLSQEEIRNMSNLLGDLIKKMENQLEKPQATTKAA